MKNTMFTQHVSNKGVTIKELLVVVSVFLLVIGALTPFVNMSRARSRRMDCANNLRKISLGLHAYAADHNDAFPATLGELYPIYVDSEKVFDCPAVKSIGVKEKPDYKYTFGLTEYSPPKEVIVEDLDGNHRKSGKNIVRVDGTVEWIDGRR
jgi:type II secretory pathway pseudopilin PulG